MAEITLVKAVNEALANAMDRDPSVCVLGEDVGRDGGVFRATEGLLGRFGPGRVIDTPLNEGGIVGMAIGMAMNGASERRVSTSWKTVRLSSRFPLPSTRMILSSVRFGRTSLTPSAAPSIRCCGSGPDCGSSSSTSASTSPPQRSCAIWPRWRPPILPASRLLAPKKMAHGSCGISMAITGMLAASNLLQIAGATPTSVWNSIATLTPRVTSVSALVRATWGSYSLSVMIRLTLRQSATRCRPLLTSCTKGNSPERPA